MGFFIDEDTIAVMFNFNNIEPKCNQFSIQKKKPVSIFALHDSEWEYLYIVPMLKIFN